MKLIKIAVAAIAVALGTQAVAQDFPTKSVRMVIPFPAGAGANDVIGRFVAQKLSTKWGQPVVVENKPGANATIGALDVVRSAPDGHTMMFTSANYAMTPAVADVPFDAEKDLKGAAMVALGEYLLITGPHLGVTDMAGFIKLGKERQLTFAGGTAGADVAALLLMKAGDFEMKRITYTGTNDALVDLLGGRLDFVVAAVGAQVGNIEAGTVVGLAVTGAKPSPQLPQVPALRDIGLEAAELPTWWSIMVPAGTPDDVVLQINEAVDAVIADPETVAFLEKQGATPNNMKPEALQAMIGESIRNYVAVVKGGN